MDLASLDGAQLSLSNGDDDVIGNLDDGRCSFQIRDSKSAIHKVLRPIISGSKTNQSDIAKLGPAFSGSISIIRKFFNENDGISESKVQVSSSHKIKIIQFSTIVFYYM